MWPLSQYDGEDWMSLCPFFFNKYKGNQTQYTVYFNYVLFRDHFWLEISFFFITNIQKLDRKYLKQSQCREREVQTHALSHLCADVYSQFIVITYFLAVIWLLVFAFSAIPVYFFFNMAATCRTIDFLSETPSSINQLCMDARQFGNKPTLDASNIFITLVLPLDSTGI